MRITKEMKVTEIYFDEKGKKINIYTYNAGLKRRLKKFAQEFPQCCQQTDDDEFGGLRFEIDKGRFSFRLSAPYTAERKRSMSEVAKRTKSYNNFKNSNY